jgi:hypothetical protein
MSFFLSHNLEYSLVTVTRLTLHPHLDTISIKSMELLSGKTTRDYPARCLYISFTTNVSYSNYTCNPMLDYSKVCFDWKRNTLWFEINSIANTLPPVKNTKWVTSILLDTYNHIRIILVVIFHCAQAKFQKPAFVVLCIRAFSRTEKDHVCLTQSV